MSASPISKRFGAVVRAHRVRRGISQEALAEGARLHVTYISMIERGTRNPTIDVADRIASALETPLGVLIAECAVDALRE